MTAALFVRSNSIYKTLKVDCYDEKRNALSWRGGEPGIFHPPCRAWGQLSHFAKPAAHEMDLARWSMHKVRQFGGVLEHPYASRLFTEFNCSSHGVRDMYGGVLIPVYQSWFGHRAPKKTLLYIVGNLVPHIEYQEPLMVQSVESMSQAAREHTPPLLALFLVELANGCVV